MLEVLTRSSPRAAASWGLAILLLLQLLGLACLFGGQHVAGTLIILLSAGIADAMLVALAAVVALGLPRATPFAERSLLNSRLASAARALKAALVITISGFFGARIATDMSTLGPAADLVGYLSFTATMVVALTMYVVVLPGIVGLGVDLLRAGETARRFAIHRVVGGSGFSDTWTVHLASRAFAWVILMALVLFVPLTTAVIFWIPASLGVW